jgi:hypothetical protein
MVASPDRGHMNAYAEVERQMAVALIAGFFRAC